MTTREQCRDVLMRVGVREPEPWQVMAIHDFALWIEREAARECGEAAEEWKAAAIENHGKLTLAELRLMQAAASEAGDRCSVCLLPVEPLEREKLARHLLPREGYLARAWRACLGCGLSVCDLLLERAAAARISKLSNEGPCKQCGGDHDTTAHVVYPHIGPNTK